MILDNKAGINILKNILLVEYAMKITVEQITESPKDVVYNENIDELNRIYSEAKIQDFHFPAVIEVNLIYYRSGEDLFFTGRFRGTVEGCCSRCLKLYSFPIEKNFDFVLTPQPQSEKKRELNTEEMGLSFYAGKEIELYPFIREQVLLSLPIRPLCDENCRGLCSGCGANLNDEVCLCFDPKADARMGIFRALKINQQ
ncbi:MAG: DUF177 domain-containing protein [Deltaproteobacteria bacterium]|nr:DUF177 domain-containing protein [Deltaproteobacteria bacterium]